MNRAPRRLIRRAGTYLGVAVVLAFLTVGVKQLNWIGSTELHTIMEVAATIIALVVGVIALARFHTRKTNAYLFLGIGFLGTAFLDGYRPGYPGRGSRPPFNRASVSGQVGINNHRMERPTSVEANVFASPRRLPRASRRAGRQQAFSMLLHSDRYKAIPHVANATEQQSVRCRTRFHLTAPLLRRPACIFFFIVTATTCSPPRQSLGAAGRSQRTNAYFFTR